MVTAIWTIVIFCSIIAIHEFGHFITAKLSGMSVFEFSVGMGPQIFGFTKGETKYTLRLLPIGGFCNIDGENGDSNNPRAFCNKSFTRRFTVLASGAFMNIVLGFLIFVFMFSVLPPQISTTISEVSEGSAAYEAGILTGDRIVAMKSESFSTNVRIYDDISFFASQCTKEDFDIVVKRGDDKLTFNITPKKDTESGKRVVGIALDSLDKNLLTILHQSFFRSLFVVKVVIISFYQLITATVPLSSLSGPVGIINEINTAAKVNSISVMNLAAFISINLGVVNLLPLPALDGGRILFLIIEKIRRKPLEQKYEGLIHFIGFVLLMIIALLVTFSDVIKLIGA